MLAGAGLASVAVRAIGLGKELLVASRFGTGDAIEAFFMALAVPALVSGALRSATLASFVPRFVAAREREGPRAAGRLLAWSLARQALVSGVAAASLALLAHPIALVVASGFPEDKQLLTEHLLVLLSVLVFFDGVAAVWSAALQAEGRIVISTLGLAGAPLATLVALVTTTGSTAEILVFGTVAGALAEAVWAAAFLGARGWSPLSLKRPWTAHARESTLGFAKLALGSAILAINPIVDQAMAAHLGAGSVAELGYGGRIVGGILGVVAMAFGTAALPRYSMYVAAADGGGLGRAYRRDSLFVLVLGVGIALSLIVVSTPVTRLLYERGAFSAADTAAVARVQAFCAAQLPGYLFGILGSRVLSVLGREWELLAIACVGALLNVAGNLVLSRWLGVAGIALSTGLVYTASAVTMALIVRRALPRVG
jgi:putative peptidoglycan lipid II flippase